VGNITRRRFVGTAAAAATALGCPALLSPAQAANPSLVPRKLPVPNDKLGTYEPTISADGNTIYFARFASVGDPRVKGPTDLFVIRRIRQGGEWPGTAEDWSAPERLSDAVNGADAIDQEPWITPDGNSLYFMSSRKAPGVGPLGIWVTHKQSDGQWGQAQPVAGGNINGDFITHCFMPFELPGQPSLMSFISIRPREPGAPATTDIYTTQQVNGVWQPAKRYESRLLDSIALKCRINVVTKDDLTLGVVSVHDFGKFHTLLFVHYDPKSKEWKGPIVEAPFNDWNIDGACVNFQANGDRMIWSAGYEHGPDLISGGSNGAGGLYDLYWLPTSEVVAYYKARAGIG
jgi:hypothetical protein